MAQETCLFYKIVNKLTSPYLFKLLPTFGAVIYNTARTKRFEITFFPYCVHQWNRLDKHFKKLQTALTFKAALLNFIRPKCNPTYNIHDPVGVVYLNRLRIGFSHLHNFSDTNDPFCNCRTNSIETPEHYLLHCPNFSSHRKTLFDNLQKLKI